MKFTTEQHSFIFDYWQTKKGTRRAPARSDIDPLDFPTLLPNIFMFDVLRDPLDYRMRLIGTNLTQVMERDCTGFLFDEIYKGSSAKKLRREYEQATFEFKPVFSEVVADWMGREYLTYHRLLLPLSTDDSQVDILLGCTFFEQKDTTPTLYTKS